MQLAPLCDEQCESKIHVMGRYTVTKKMTLTFYVQQSHLDSSCNNLGRAQQLYPIVILTHANNPGKKTDFAHTTTVVETHEAFNSSPSLKRAVTDQSGASCATAAEYLTIQQSGL
jgi:hypothetical protein